MVLSEEAVANITKIFHDAIVEKNDQWQEEKEALVSDKADLVEAAEKAQEEIENLQFGPGPSNPDNYKKKNMNIVDDTRDVLRVLTTAPKSREHSEFFSSEFIHDNYIINDRVKIADLKILLGTQMHMKPFESTKKYIFHFFQKFFSKNRKFQNPKVSLKSVKASCVALIEDI